MAAKAINNKMQDNININITVLSQIKIYFESKDVDQVIKSLGELHLPMIGANTGRVHLALIFLSKGDVALFHKLKSEAVRDWRDILIKGNLGNANWRDVLKARGIDISEEESNPQANQ